MLLIGIIIALIILVIASITDLKKREVPDYISYGLIFIAFAVAAIESLLEWNYIPLLTATMGFVIGVIIAYSMFYLGQWGGGDSKLIMGLGAVFGFNAFRIFGKNDLWLIVFICGIIFFGAIYGLFWSVLLAIKKRKMFIESFKRWISRKEILIARRIVLSIVILLLIAIVTIVPQDFRIVMLTFVIMLYTVFYIWLFVKVIEETCMIKEVPVSRLTEGDWIYKDVYIGKRYITGPKDLGVSREQIAVLKKYSKQGKIRTVMIKEGIPFIPAFLISFVATIIIYLFGITF